MPQGQRTLTAQEIAARRRNAHRSTGLRTTAGKRRSRLNRLQHAVYSRGELLWDTISALGEDPEEFKRFLRSLIAARQPADAVEMMLVEDIAMTMWKKARVERIQAAVQLRNLESLLFERQQHMLDLTHNSYRGLQADIVKMGLHRAAFVAGRRGARCDGGIPAFRPAARGDLATDAERRTGSQ